MKALLHFLIKSVCCLLFAVLVCACSKEETPEPPLTADFSFKADPSDPGRITFINQSKSASYFDWDFGDYTFNTSGVNPSHTYFSNDTFHVTLTAYYSEKGTGKFPGTRSGLGEKITKQVIVANTKSFFNVKISVPGEPPFIFTSKAAQTNSWFNTNEIEINAQISKNRYRNFKLVIPSSAKSGSTYTINSQQQSQSKARISYNEGGGVLTASDDSCPGSYGTITITTITQDFIQGTFSGKLVDANCANRHAIVENGEFSFRR